MKLQYIEFLTNDSLPASVRESIPDEKTQDLFRASLNSHLRDGKSEMHAYIKAYRFLEETGYERREGKWVQKESPTVGDVHVDAPLGSGGPAPKQRKPAGLKQVPDNAGAHIVSKRISGSSNIALNAEGKKLADELGKRVHLKGGMDVLRASPLKRAQQTAEAIEKHNPQMAMGAPNPALQPWHLGEFEGQDGGEVKHRIAYFIEHPDERPPGKGADGKPAETFNEAKKRQLDFWSDLVQASEDHPTAKIGVVAHSRGVELLSAWVDAGMPEDYQDLDLKDLLKPDDPAHASMLRLHKGKLKDIPLDEDDELKPGIYVILHSLTDDDGDKGNEELEKAGSKPPDLRQSTGEERCETCGYFDLDKHACRMFEGYPVEADQVCDEYVAGEPGTMPAAKRYLPPVEVQKAAAHAHNTGTVALGITEPLAKGEGLTESGVRKVAEHFAANLRETAAAQNAWGGPSAGKWAERVLRKIERDRIEKAGTGVMVAFWPDADVAKKLAIAGAEKPEELHLTLAYLGKNVDPERAEALQAALATFAAGHGSVSGTIGGPGRFNATAHSDGKDVAFASFESATIQEFRAELVAAIEAAGSTVVKNFGYTPHMTLAYIDPGADMPVQRVEPVDVTFGTLVLSIGSERKEYPLSKINDYLDADKRGAVQLVGNITKVDGERMMAFGWFSIVSVDGRPVEDTQGDVISPETIEDAAYEFVLQYRIGGEMHERDEENNPVIRGALVESCVFTQEKQTAMVQSLRDQGIEAVLDLRCVAWWGGFKFDKETFARIKTGELRAWSFGGRAKREKIAA